MSGEVPGPEHRHFDDAQARERSGSITGHGRANYRPAPGPVGASPERNGLPGLVEQAQLVVGRIGHAPLDRVGCDLATARRRARRARRPRTTPRAARRRRCSRSRPATASPIPARSRLHDAGSRAGSERGARSRLANARSRAGRRALAAARRPSARPTAFRRTPGGSRGCRPIRTACLRAKATTAESASIASRTPSRPLSAVRGSFLSRVRSTLHLSVSVSSSRRHRW